jgi:hypothetical protein
MISAKHPSRDYYGRLSKTKARTSRGAMSESAAAAG